MSSMKHVMQHSQKTRDFVPIKLVGTALGTACLLLLLCLTPITLSTFASPFGEARSLEATNFV